MTPQHTVIFLGLVVWAGCEMVSEEAASQVESTSVPPIIHAERRMSIDPDDNVGETSGMSSYSSVVIHHPVHNTDTGHQTTSQWTIENHKEPGHKRTSQVEHNQQPLRQTSQRHHRHHARSGATSTHLREEATPEPETLSTAQTFFRLRGYKAKTEATTEDTRSSQDNDDVGYDDVTSTGHQYVQGSPHVVTSHRQQTLPPGMTHDLMNALLSQQPQTFDYGFKSSPRSDEVVRTNSKNQESHSRSETSVRPSRKPQKKYKNQVQTEAAEKAKKRLSNKNRDSFNVGYSIGFGNPTLATVTEQPTNHHGPNDVVLGRPKSHGSSPNFKLHVNGENSVWKEIQPGVEMSQETIKNSPHSLTVPESARNTPYYQEEPQLGLLSGHPGQSIYYLNAGLQPDVYTVPTTGQATFDHAHALGQSNTFDFSNAVSHVSSPVQQSSQSKQDSPSNVKSPKQIQPSQFNKQQQNIIQSYLSSSFPQKSVVPYSAQSQSYYPYNQDSSKSSSPTNSKSSSEYSSPSSHATGKSKKNQQPISSTGLAGGYDLSQFMGFGTPVPIQNVFIPGNKEGEGQMVPAIVIPISQLSGFDNFGPGLNYLSDASDGYQSFGGDVFNVVPQGMTKESLNSLGSGKFGSGKPHNPRMHDKPSRGAKGGSHHGVTSHIGLSAPEHLEGSRPMHSKHSRPDSRKPYSGGQQKILAPKFSQQEQFMDSSVNLKRSPSNRSARLAQLQSELNSILAEEMYRKNRSNRRQAQPHHIRMLK